MFFTLLGVLFTGFCFPRTLSPCPFSFTGILSLAVTFGSELPKYRASFERMVLRGISMGGGSVPLFFPKLLWLSSFRLAPNPCETGAMDGEPSCLSGSF
jgi:hypothetical protein